MPRKLQAATAEIHFKLGHTKFIDYVDIERDEETITFIMADGTRWPVDKEACESIFIPV